MSKFKLTQHTRILIATNLVVAQLWLYWLILLKFNCNKVFTLATSEKNILICLQEDLQSHTNCNGSIRENIPLNMT